MNFFSILEDPQTLLAFAAALAVFTAILTVSWPYLARDNLSTRMRQVASERERIRARLQKLAGTVPTGIENARQWKLRGPKPQKGRDLFMSIRYKIEPSKYLNAAPEFKPGDSMGLLFELD